MRCFGTNKDNETCDLCKRVDIDYFNKCIDEHMRKVNLSNKLREIKNNCPYRKECWDEYDQFDGCIKDGKSWGRHTPNCCPKLECENI